MRGPVVQAFVVLVLAAGCGGNGAADRPPTTTAVPPARTTPPAATLTSASDRAMCAELESKIRLVSQVVSGSVELMTQSLHPKELARQTGKAQQNITYAAGSLELMRVPASLATARRNLVVGLNSFAADFGKAKASVEHGDIAAAAQQLVDRPALAKVSSATKKIDRACGA
jgi:hypothetical protein